MTPDDVRKYMWPHLDWGKFSLSTPPDNWDHFKRAGYKHGDKVEINGHKAIFRLIEAGLYRDDWMAEALPIAKEIWENYQPGDE